MKVELDKMIGENKSDLELLIKARLYSAKCSNQFDVGDMISECYIYLSSLNSVGLQSIDYLKLAKKWITNQSFWQPASGQPKESHKNFKSKHKFIGFTQEWEGMEFAFDEVDNEALDFAFWVEKKLDKPEKVLFKMYFIEGKSHRHIASQIRLSGLKISDTSIYLEIRKLKDKLKKLSIIWREI